MAGHHVSDVPWWVEACITEAPRIRPNTLIGVYRHPNWLPYNVFEVHGTVLRAQLCWGFREGPVFHSVMELIDLDDTEVFVKIGWALCKLQRDEGLLLPTRARLLNDNANHVELGYAFEGCDQLFWCQEEDKSARLFNVSNNVRRQLGRPANAAGCTLPCSASCEGITAVSMQLCNGRLLPSGHMGDSTFRLHPRVYELCFHPDFRKRVDEAEQGVLVQVGQGRPSTRSGHKPVPNRNAPSPLRYTQSADEWRCVAYGLASALWQSGDHGAAEDLAGAAASIVSCAAGAEFLYKRGGFRVDRLHLEDMDLADAVERLKDPVVPESLFLLGLQDSQLSENHSVTVYNRLIFDANEKRPLRLSEWNLHRCLGEGYRCKLIRVCYVFSKHRRGNKRPRKRGPRAQELTDQQ